jgi:ribonuclease VapC
VIVDSSAIVAVLRREAEADRFAGLLAATSQLKMSAATYVELACVVDRRIGPLGLARLDEFLEGLQIAIVDFTAQQAQLARYAYVTFGKSHHDAALNFGDCFTYALAKETGEPLLFKGNDFAKTDVSSAL